MTTNRAVDLIAIGFTREYLIKKMESGVNTVDLLVEQISVEVRDTVTKAAVRDLLKRYKLSTKEYKSYNTYTTYSSKRIASLTAAESIAIKKIHEEYISNSLVSLNDVADDMSHLLKMKLDRKHATIIFNKMQLKSRSRDLINKSKEIKAEEERVYWRKRVRDERELALKKSGYSLNELEAMHSSGRTLESLSRLTKLRVYDLKVLFEEADMVVKRTKIWSELKDELLIEGVDRDFLKKILIEDNLPQKEIRTILSQKINAVVSEKHLTKILAFYELKKTPENIKELQGAKSKLEYIDSMRRLKLAGFESPAALAKHYEETKTLTRQTLLEQMNARLAPHEPQFTDRWLERHMVPNLSDEHALARGTSRVELEFIEFVKTLYEGEVLVNYRSLITPYELDLYIPELKLAFEFNGDYWHSDKFLLLNHKMSSEEYHRNKFERCAALDVKLFFVWESDWYFHKDSVKNAIESALKGKSISELLRKLVSASNSSALTV